MDTRTAGQLTFVIFQALQLAADTPKGGITLAELLREVAQSDREEIKVRNILDSLDDWQLIEYTRAAKGTRSDLRLREFSWKRFGEVAYEQRRAWAEQRDFERLTDSLLGPRPDDDRLLSYLQ